jgi:glycosyltransferase involved in cell wall biosynthesis
VTVIPYGIDTERFQPRDRHFARQLFRFPPDVQVVLFVADWVRERRKGLDLLLEALRRLEGYPQLHLLAIGHGAASLELGELGERTTGIEFVRDERLMSLVYSAADLFVIPTLQDNLPLTALEALACGIPTVGFDVGGLPDIVREGQTGSLTRPGDVLALRNAIAELLHDPERRASMAQTSRRIAVEE